MTTKIQCISRIMRAFMAIAAFYLFFISLAHAESSSLASLHFRFEKLGYDPTKGLCQKWRPKAEVSPSQLSSPYFKEALNYIARHEPNRKLKNFAKHLLDHPEDFPQPEYQTASVAHIQPLVDALEKLEKLAPAHWRFAYEQNLPAIKAERSNNFTWSEEWNDNPYKSLSSEFINAFQILKNLMPEGRDLISSLYDIESPAERDEMAKEIANLSPGFRRDCLDLIFKKKLKIPSNEIHEFERQSIHEIYRSLESAEQTHSLILYLLDPNAQIIARLNEYSEMDRVDAWMYLAAVSGRISWVIYLIEDQNAFGPFLSEVIDFLKENRPNVITLHYLLKHSRLKHYSSSKI